MKKNKTMRAASALLVATLLTTSIISGTFAKYTTQASGEDSARVAKWGVELQTVGNLYGDTYKDSIVKGDETSMTVQSLNAAADVVAPGTKNDEGFTFSLKGQPEVAGTVTTTMKIQNVFLKANTYGVMIPVDDGKVTEETFDEFASLYYLDGATYKKATAWSDAENKKFYTLEDEVTTGDYYPVVYSLAGNTTSTSGTTKDSLKEAATQIATAMGLTAGIADNDTSVTYTGTKSFAANAKLDDWKVDGETLTWAWAYGENSGVGNAAAVTDKADTILGMLENVTEGKVVKANAAKNGYEDVVEYTDYCLDTQFSIDITVTQAD